MKPKILFVGAFVDKGVKGGQLFACRTLVDSPLKELVEWDLLDTTMESLPPPPLLRRTWLAGLRLAKFVSKMLFGRYDAAIIFSDAGLGFLEKGIMAQLAALRGIPVLFSIRSGYIKDAVEGSRLIRWWLRRVFGFSSRIVCQGTGWKAFFIRHTGLPEARFTVIMNAIDPAPYLGIVPISPKPSIIRILFIGWLDANKGLFDLVRALTLAGEALNGVCFDIAGNGPDEAVLKQTVLAAGMADKFTFHGWVDSPTKLELLADADILVLPSHREGLPNVILEAMAAGRPVVATRVGAIPDVIEHGLTGYLCEPSNPESLAAALVKMCNSESRPEMGAAARNAVLEHHDSAGQWRLWRNLLGEAGASFGSRN